MNTASPDLVRSTTPVSLPRPPRRGDGLTARATPPHPIHLDKGAPTGTRVDGDLTLGAHPEATVVPHNDDSDRRHEQRDDHQDGPARPG